MWLTFDDAYADHYTNVFPILDEMGIEGAFFAPVKAITWHEVLNVNKVHFVLASVKDINELIDNVRKPLDEYREQYQLQSNEYYFNKLAVANRFDPKEVIFVKRLLQVELVEELRNHVNNWVILYPYGAYKNLTDGSSSLIEVIRARGCKLALTTEVARAELNRENAFKLPRFDTNDFPKDRNAEFKSIN